MRTGRTAAGLALVLTLVGGVGVRAAADEATPTQRDVEAAQEAAAGAATDVSAVQAQLALANERLQAASVAAAQAAEAYNGARWRAAEARKAVRQAERRLAVAGADQAAQREAYADSIVASYQRAPELGALAALGGAEGLEAVIEARTTMRNGQQAMDQRHDAFRATTVLAGLATEQAAEAQAAADAAADEARSARDAAAAAAGSAAAEARSVAEEKTRLIARLAELQGISADLAEARQSALEREAAEAAAAAAAAAQQEAEAQGQAQAPADEADDVPAAAPTSPAAAPGSPAPTPSQSPAPASMQPSAPATPPASPSTSPAPSHPPAPQPPKNPPPAPQPAPQPPAPASGAQAAIAFARAQVGEPYRWGAAGPSAWDCSGLTMGAWQQGGRSLPHYSVAQYEQSTTISAGQLQPGDLVFWGSSSRSSSIYHVALYVGGGRILHAPRTGRPVVEESMYSWIAPNFFARP